MPKTKIAKPIRFAEPHTVDIPDLESYTELTGKPPYSHLRRILPQYFCSMMLHRLHGEGKRYVRLYLPGECFAPAYRTNPPLFAKIVRQQRDSSFQFIVARYETPSGRMRITASEEPQQKQSSYLGSCGACLLAEHSKNEARAKPDPSFALVFPYTEMPISYKNDQRVFRFRLEAWMRQKLAMPKLAARLHFTDNGYRITIILPE